MRRLVIPLFCILIVFSFALGCSPKESAIPAPPIPVVLITGYPDLPDMPIPKELIEPLSTNAPISEKTIRLEPWGKEGDSYRYVLPYSLPSHGRDMVDIVIQTKPVEGDYYLLLSITWGERGTISWAVGPTVDMEDVEKYPVLPQCRFFYKNKTTRVETLEGNYTTCNTALRLVLWEENGSLPCLSFRNSSDEPAYITYKIYDAGTIGDFPEYWQWLDSYYSWRYKTEDWVQWQKASKSWNLEGIPFSNLVT